MSLGLKIQLENKDSVRNEYLNFIKELNNQKINLGINFNNNTIGDIQKELDKLKQQFNNVEFMPKINDREFKNGIANQIEGLKRFTGSIEQIKKELSSLGEVKIKSNTIDDGGIRTFVASVKDSLGKVTELNYAINKIIGDKPSYKFEGFKSITDNTDKTIKDLDKFKNEVQKTLNNINNSGFADKDIFKSIQNEISNLNISTFKEKTKEIQNNLKELEKQAKSSQEAFNSIAKFSSEQQNKINTLFNNDILPKNKIINIEAKISGLNGNESQQYIKSLENEINNLINSEKLLTQENKNYQNSVKQTFKEEGNAINYVIQQEERLKNIRSSYNNKLDTGSNGYKQLENEYNSLIQKLEQYKQEGKTLTIEESNNIKTRINDLAREKNSVIEITNNIKQQEGILQSLQSKFGKIITEDEQLSGIVNKLKADIQGLNTSNNFKGDSSGINEQINQLKQLASEKQRVQNLGTNLGSFSSTGLNLNSSAKEMENYIKSIEKGKVQLTQIGEIIEKNGQKFRQFHYTVDLGNNQFQKYTATINESDNSIRKLGTGIEDTSSKQISFRQKLVQAFEAFTGFSLVMGSAYAAIHQVESGIKSVINMESDLATISVTMSTNKQELKNLGIAAEEMGMKYGVAVDQVVNAMKVYANMSENTASIVKKSQADIVLASLSNMNTTDTTNLIQGTMNQFNMQAKDAEKIADIYTSISASMPMDFEKGIQQISQGIMVSGSSAKEAGMSLEQYASVLGNVVSQTRLGGSQVANAEKTIFQRITAAKKGATTTDEGEDVSKVETAFKSVGVEIRDTATSFRPMNDILTELSQKWKTMDDVTKSYIATQAAGVRQGNIFRTMMNGYDQTISLTNTAMNSQGFAMEANNKKLDTTAKKYEELKATMTTQWLKAINSDSFKPLIDGAITLEKTFGNLHTVILTAVTAFAILKGKAITGLVTDLMGVAAGETVTTVATVGLSTAFNTLKTAIISNPIGAIAVAFTTLVSVIELANSKTNEYNESNKQLQDSTKENISGNNANIKQLQGIQKEYEELSSKTSLTADEMKRYNEICEQIAGVNKEATIAYDNQGKAILSMKGNVDDLIKSLKEKNQLENLKLENNIGNQYKEYNNVANKNKPNSNDLSYRNMSGLNDVDENLKKKKEALAKYEKQREELIKGNKSTASVDSNIKSVENQIDSLTNKVKQAKLEQDEAFSKLKTNILAIVQDGSKYNDMFDKMDNSTKKLLTDSDFLKTIFKPNGDIEAETQQYKKFIETISNSGAYKAAQEGMKKLTDTQQQMVNKSMSGFNINDFAKNDKMDEYYKIMSTIENEAKKGTPTLKEFKKALSSFPSAKDFKEEDWKKLFDSMTNGAKDASDSIEETAKSFEDLQKGLQTNLTKIEGYEKILNDIKNNGKLSASDSKEIINKDPELIPYLDNVNKLATVISGKVDDLKTKSSQNLASMGVAEEKKSLQALADTYNELSSKQDLDSGQKEQLANATRQLQERVEGFNGIQTDDGNIKLKNIQITNDKVLSLENEAKYLALVSKVGKEKADATINDEFRQTNASINGVNGRIEQYKREIKALEIVTKGRISTFGEKAGGFLNKLFGDDDKLAKQKSNLEGAEGELKGYEKSLGDLKQMKEASTSGTEALNKAQEKINGMTNTLSESTDKNSKAIKKNAAEQKALANAIKKVKNEMKSYELQIRGLDNALYGLDKSMEGMAEHSIEYENALEKQNEMYRQRITLVNGAKEANNGYINSIGGMSGLTGSALGQQVVAKAEQYLGTPYQYGGKDPLHGIDCSGLVTQAFKEIGVDVSGSTYDQINKGTPVAKENLQPGDLVFFGSSSDPHHVGIYAGNGNFVEAPHTGSQVRISSLSNRSDYLTGRRIVTGGDSPISNGNINGGYTGQYADIINEASQKFNIPSTLIAALIKQESDFQNLSPNSAGAMGIMQVTRGSAQDSGFGNANLMDIRTNIMAGATELKKDLEKAGGDARTAVGYYNAGLYGNLNNSETQNHMKKVMEYYKEFGGEEGTIDTATGEIENILGKNQDYEKQNMDYTRKIIENNTKKYESRIGRFDDQLAHVGKNEELAKAEYELNKINTSKDGLETSSKEKEQMWKEINNKNSVLVQKEEYISNELKSSKYDHKTLSAMQKNLEETIIQRKNIVIELHQEFQNWQEEIYMNVTKVSKENIEFLESKLNTLNKASVKNYQEKITLNNLIIGQNDIIKDKTYEQIDALQKLINVEKDDNSRQIWINEQNTLIKQLEELNQKEVDLQQKNIEHAKNNAFDKIEKQVYDGLTEQQFEDRNKAKINALKDELEVISKQDEKLAEQEDRQKRLLELEELKIKLQKEQNNLNVQQLTKDKNGDWQFQYVADQKVIDDLEKQMRDKSKDNSKWETDQKKKHDKDKIDEQIKDLENQSAIRKEAMDRIKHDVEEALKNEENLFANGKADINKIAETTLEDLNKIYNGKFNNIVSTVKDSIGKIKGFLGDVNSEFVDAQKNIGAIKNIKPPGIDDKGNPKTVWVTDMESSDGQTAQNNYAKLGYKIKEINDDNYKQSTDDDILLGYAGNDKTYGKKAKGQKLVGTDRYETEKKAQEDALNQQKALLEKHDGLMTQEKKVAMRRNNVIIKSGVDGETRTVKLGSAEAVNTVATSLKGVNDITYDQMGNMVVTVRSRVSEAVSAIQELLAAQSQAGMGGGSIPTSIDTRPTIIAKGSDAAILKAQYGDSVRIVEGSGFSGEKGSTRYDTNLKYQNYLSQMGVTPKNSNVGDLYKYKKGGETQRTGMHWLDGEDSEPERVLDSTQTKGFNELVFNQLPQLKNIIPELKSIMPNLMNSIQMPSLNFKTPDLSGINQAQTVEHKYYIDKVELPNITNESGLENLFDGIDNYALQYSMRR